MVRDHGRFRKPCRSAGEAQRADSVPDLVRVRDLNPILLAMLHQFFPGPITLARPMIERIKDEDPRVRDVALFRRFNGGEQQVRLANQKLDMGGPDVVAQLEDCVGGI